MRTGNRHGYIIFSTAVSAAAIAFIVLKLIDPSLLGGQLRRVWLNRFFAMEACRRPYILICAGCALAALVSLASGRLRKVFDNPLLFAALFSIPFFVTGFETTYGDSDTWVNWIRYRYFMSEPGSTLIHNIAYSLLHQPFNLGARSVIALTSRLAGVASLAVIAMISNALFTDTRRRMFFRLVLYFSGLTLLFFGYIENTPLLVPFELLYLYFAVRYIRRDSPRELAMASLFLSLGSIVHGSVCFVLPSLFVVILAKFGFDWKRLLKAFSLALALYVLPIALFLSWVFFVDRGGMIGAPYGNALGGGDRQMFVPLFKTSGFVHYTLFSRYHFLDMLNILLAGAGVCIVTAAAFAVINLFRIRRDVTPLLIGYLVARLGFLFLWNCDWGFFKDWDLMIPNALPFLLIAGCAVAGETRGRGSCLAASPLLLANIMIAVMFFFVLNGKPPALLRVQRIDPLHAGESPCAGEGLVASFYTDDTFGTPVGEARTDVPYHLWGRRGPTADLPEQPFGVVWDGFLRVRDEGRHRFHYVVEGDYRFYLNGRLVDERWKKGGKARREKELRLSPGFYRFRLEYYIEKGAAAVQYTWECADFDKRKMEPGDFCIPDTFINPVKRVMPSG